MMEAVATSNFPTDATAARCQPKREMGVEVFTSALRGTRVAETMPGDIDYKNQLIPAACWKVTNTVQTGAICGNV